MIDVLVLAAPILVVALAWLGVIYALQLGDDEGNIVTGFSKLGSRRAPTPHAPPLSARRREEHKGESGEV